MEIRYPMNHNSGYRCADIQGLTVLHPVENRETLCSTQWRTGKHCAPPSGLRCLDRSPVLRAPVSADQNVSGGVGLGLGLGSLLSCAVSALGLRLSEIRLSELCTETSCPLATSDDTQRTLRMHVVWAFLLRCMLLMSR